MVVFQDAVMLSKIEQLCSNAVQNYGFSCGQIFSKTFKGFSVTVCPTNTAADVPAYGAPHSVTISTPQTNPLQQLQLYLSHIRPCSHISLIDVRAAIESSVSPKAVCFMEQACVSVWADVCDNAITQEFHDTNATLAVLVADQSE